MQHAITLGDESTLSVTSSTVEVKAQTASGRGDSYFARSIDMTDT